MTLGAEDADTLASANNLAAFLLPRGRWEETLEILRPVFSVGDDSPNRFTSDRATVIGNLAGAYYYLGLLEDADALLTRYVPAAVDQLGETHPTSTNLTSFQARVWLDQGKAEKAFALLVEVVENRREIYPDGGAPLVPWRQSLRPRPAQLALKDLIGAERSLTEAREVFREFPPPLYFSAWADCCLGSVLTDLRSFDDAEPLLLDAEQRLRGEQACPKRHYRHTVEQLIQLYDLREIGDEATFWRNRMTDMQAEDVPRSLSQGVTFLDLARVANQSLDESLHEGGDHENGLDKRPRGLIRFGGTLFNVSNDAVELGGDRVPN